MEEDLKTQINEAKGEKAEVKAKVQEAKQAEALKQEEEKARAEEEAQKAKEDENAKAREEAEKRKVMDSILELNGELNGIYAEIDVETRYYDCHDGDKEYYQEGIGLFSALFDLSFYIYIHNMHT